MGKKCPALGRAYKDKTCAQIQCCPDEGGVW